MQEFWSEKDIAADIANAFNELDTIAIVAESDDQMLGFVWGYRLPAATFLFLEFEERTSYVDDIAVRGDARQSGIGSALMDAYLEQAQAQGMVSVVLRTDRRNSASMSLFEKKGFRPVQREGESVYDPVFSDRIYLARTLETENV